MENIRDLFIKTYGFEPQCDEALNVFIDILKQRLSYNEKAYVQDRYGVDLLSDEEIERHIIISMNHPIIKREITNFNS